MAARQAGRLPVSRRAPVPLDVVAPVGRATKNTRSHPLGVQAGHPRRIIVAT